MPFNSTDSLTSTNMNNMLRGLYRDNSDHVLTGTATETTLASTTITANTIGATGSFYVRASGTTTGAAGTKSMRAYFGGTLANGVTSSSAADSWILELWYDNTATNAQRVTLKLVTYNSATGAITTTVGGVTTAAID